MDIDRARWLRLIGAVGNGRNHGVQGGRQPGAILPGHNGGLEVGDLGAKGGWLN